MDSKKCLLFPRIKLLLIPNSKVEIVCQEMGARGRCLEGEECVSYVESILVGFKRSTAASVLGVAKWVLSGKAKSIFGLVVMCEGNNRTGDWQKCW